MTEELLRPTLTPIFPAPPTTAEDLPHWGRYFTESVTRAFDDLSIRIEEIKTELEDAIDAITP